MSIPELPPEPLEFKDKPILTTPLAAAILNPWGQQVHALAAAARSYAIVAQDYAGQAGALDDAAVHNVIETEGSARALLDLLYGQAPAVAFLDVAHFGAAGDGEADDTFALQQAIDSELPIDFGGPDRTYKITGALTRTLTRTLAWRSTGAKIVLAAAAPIARAIDIACNGNSIIIDGPLTLDCTNTAYTGWYFLNATSTSADVTAVGLGVRNCFRGGTAFTGGDGIHVRGKFTNVHLVRPDVRMITMAEGAGVSGSQGVAGITVSAAPGGGMGPGEINIDHPYISDVYSLDAAYTMDQDGIRVFTEEDAGSTILFETHFTIAGGAIRNCGGRAIKSQCEFGVVDGVKFTRRHHEAAPIARIGAMPEIDFQVGGGMVANCEFQYVTACPTSMIRWVGTRQVGGKIATGVQVRDCKVSWSGLVPTRFMSVFLAEQARGVIDVTGVEVQNPANRFSMAFLTADGKTTDELILRLTNITIALNAGIPFFRRTGVAMPTFASMTNLANIRSLSIICAFNVLDTAGSYTQVTSGQNIRVA